MSKRIVTISLRPTKVLVWLVGISLLLVLVHMGLQFSKFHGGPAKLEVFADLFNVDSETSIPTWFSQFMLLGSAAVAMVIGRYKSQAGQPYALQWKLVAAVFAFLSIDEIATIHEHLIDIVARNQAGLHVGLGSWYTYALIMVGLATLLLAKFWWRLPLRTKCLLALAAAIYLFGAVFFDSYDGGFVGRGWLHDGFLVGIEEGLEMLGACLFAYALCDYARTERLLAAVSFYTIDKSQTTAKRR